MEQNIPAADLEPCRFCKAEAHIGTPCPWVKALDFEIDIDGNRRVSRVEFFSPRELFTREPADKAASAGLGDAEDPRDYPRLGKPEKSAGGQL